MSLVLSRWFVHSDTDSDSDIFTRWFSRVCNVQTGAMPAVHALPRYSIPFHRPAMSASFMNTKLETQKHTGQNYTEWKKDPGRLNIFITTIPIGLKLFYRLKRNSIHRFTWSTRIRHRHKGGLVKKLRKSIGQVAHKYYLGFNGENLIENGPRYKKGTVAK